MAPSGRWGGHLEQGDGAWVLHSLVDPTRKHLSEVPLLLGKFAENNAQYVQGDGGLSKRWRRMSVGGGSPDASREPKAELQDGAWLWGHVQVTKTPVIQFPF